MSCCWQRPVSDVLHCPVDDHKWPERNYRGASSSKPTRTINVHGWITMRRCTKLFINMYTFMQIIYDTLKYMHYFFCTFLPKWRFRNYRERRGLIFLSLKYVWYNKVEFNRLRSIIKSVFTPTREHSFDYTLCVVSMLSLIFSTMKARLHRCNIIGSNILNMFTLEHILIIW